MLHSCNLNNTINPTYMNELSDYFIRKILSASELLDVAKSVTVHYKDRKFLIKEIYEVENQIVPRRFR